ncbi:helix-turn-helix domain-containing protein [Psychromonas sp. RZ22]|uniref:GlxA family transcriptional regulator n=1 Tax=Psychromonas algarum TaxID=2555643 RepID=UPI00106848DA|nr:helix-turn-helix domain-containing protein [Psychromonas sp. RZ22]TEW54154.1 helix-turn-helix domain-containing protein [Psychromonas sp. RZ22]
MAEAVIRIGIFAPQGCSQLSYGAICEPFLLANQLIGQHHYHLSLLNTVKQYHTTSCHPQINHPPLIALENADLLSDLEHYDLLIIVADTPPRHAIPMPIKKVLQRYYRQQDGQILAIKAGAWWLLDSGIALTHKMVVHWSLIDHFKDRYPEVTVSHELYQTKQRISSCAGQLATLDYLIDYLSQHEEADLINQISDHLCLDRLRVGSERQRLPNKSLAGEDLQPKLTMAIDLMENNIEEPLASDEIAELISISRRQLERLFKRYLNTMPARHYLQIRLKRAQHLLQTSNKSIVQIGLSCGFSSGPHFSSSYKSFFQLTPRQERAKYLTVK